MSFYRQIKNVINNNDYFRNRRNESEYDLKEEELNINNIDNSDIDINNNYVHNNIIGENNIGKFREKINNREQIIEQNYKNLNNYQNNNRYNDDIYEIKKQYRKIPTIKPQGNNYKNSGKRMYKSESTDNALRNNYYLSQIDINKNNNINNINNNNNINNITNYYIDYTTKTLGKRRTDITDNNFIQIYTNKRNFADYYNKNVEIQNENKKITEEKNNKKKNNINSLRMKEQKEIKMENNYFNSLATQNLLGEKKSKLIYKNFLDEQVKNNINDKLLNENLTYNDLIQNRNYSFKRDYMSERKFLNKNNFVEVNPYSRRNYYLGNSFLTNDVITNPQIVFKHNKYIFPQNQF